MASCATVRPLIKLEITTIPHIASELKKKKKKKTKPQKKKKKQTIKILRGLPSHFLVLTLHKKPLSVPQFLCVSIPSTHLDISETWRTMVNC